MPAPAAITLIAMPRVCGYVFNPVSFWLCHNQAGELQTVICEVNNTFGETHSYICAPQTGAVIQADAWIEAYKVFHVSPFLACSGSYQFRFAVTDERYDIDIHYHDASGECTLITSVRASAETLSRAALRKMFWRMPLLTVMVVARIHYQALRLFCKGVRYKRKPKQHAQRVSVSEVS